MGNPHSIEDESASTEAVDVGTLLTENASLRDRLLRALAEAENTRRQADRALNDARKFAITEFARELLIVVYNLQRTVVAGEGSGTGEAREPRPR
jgi:molecular chaperone GrpE